MLLIAHRGDQNNFSENTLEAFVSAIEKGADGVELDVQLIDSKIRVVHDYLYDREKDYPLLSEILESLSQKTHLEIEIKAFNQNILVELHSVLEKFSPQDLELTTSSLPLASHISKHFIQIPLGINFDKDHYKEWMTEEIYLRKTIDYMQLMGANVAHLSNLPEEKLTPSLIETLHKNNLKTHYHIGSKPMEDQVKLYQKLNSLGLDQCTFDDIDLVTEAKKL